MQAHICRHYRQYQSHASCSAGIKYADINRECFKLSVAPPCAAAADPTIIQLNCPKREFPTAEEVAREDAALAQMGKERVTEDFLGKAVFDAMTKAAQDKTTTARRLTGIDGLFFAGIFIVGDEGVYNAMIDWLNTHTPMIRTPQIFPN